MTRIQKSAIDKAAMIIKDHEGLRLKAYKNPNDPWTIGYGHTRTARPGMVITKEQALELLKSDIAAASNPIFKAYPQLNENQLAALVSFSYNVGTAWMTKNTGKALNEGIKSGKWEPFKKWFSQWIEKGSIYENGLRKRRAEELELFFCPPGSTTKPLEFGH